MYAKDTRVFGSPLGVTGSDVFEKYLTDVCTNNRPICKIY
jgi:hypothetical protein